MEISNEAKAEKETTVRDAAAEFMRREVTGSPLYTNWNNQPTTEPPMSFGDLLAKTSIYGAAAAISPPLAGMLATYELTPNRPAPGQHELVPLDQQERSPFPLYLFE